jgi:signal transduction histidine kinase
VRPPSWLTDTIARRFVMTELLTVAATLGLAFLFSRVGGVWAAEPIDRSSLLNEVTATVRLIEATLPQARPSLASAATSGSNHVYWFAAGSEAAQFLDAGQGGDRNVARIVVQATHHPAIVLQPSRSMPAQLQIDSKGASEYILAVRLLDRSWTVFATPNRAWGPPQTTRWLIRLLFLAASISLFTAIGARKFAQPIKRLAAAVREFGLNPAAPPIAQSGPRELRQVIRTFNEMQAQIRKFLSYRTMMLAAISHDLRSPLTRIRLRGELIEDAEQQARLFRDVDEMQAMVDGALAFFRDDAVTEPDTTFDLPQLLVTVANDYADQNIELRYDGPAHAVYKGRPLALKRALNNLVDNAIKYATPPTIELACEDYSFMIVIRDGGPGIPQSALDSVFLPYYRLEKSRNRNTGGVGLGLTVAQSIVQGHGGEIVLENIPAGGLEVRVILPRGDEWPKRAAYFLSRPRSHA